jgi:ATP-dependent Clp protease ATP-binding subunit ClpA
MLLLGIFQKDWWKRIHLGKNYWVANEAVVITQVLKSMGINLKDARHETEKIIGRGSGFVAVEIPFTPRAKRVLELSLEEARQLGENHTLIGP